MAGVPYTFGTATTSIPLSNLDSNFVTPVTIGNASVALGNTITAIGNLTLNNVTINSGTINASVSESYSLANAVVYSNSSNVGVTSSNLTFDGTTLTTTNVSILGNSTNPFAVTTNANGSLPSASLNGLIISQNYISGSAEVDFFYNQSSSVGDSGGFRFYQRTGTSTVNEMMRMTQNSVITYTGGTERMRIDSSGNVDIGTTVSLWGKQTIYNVSDVNTQASLVVAGGTYNTGGQGGSVGFTNRNAVDSTTSPLQLGARIRSGLNSLSSSQENAYLAFDTNAGSNLTERMRIDSSGNLWAGTTTFSSSMQSGISLQAGGNNQIWVSHANGTVGGQNYCAFFYNGGNIGSISQNGTTGVLYNLTSDYRLKDNPVPLTGASDFIMALKPKSWDWWDGSGKGVGFIAHEFMEVAKHSGNGKKDAVDAEGKPVYQSIQPSSSEVMANLVALMQEQQALIESLTTRLTALENK